MPSRPAPYRVSPRRTLWVDYSTGQGVDDQGRTIALRRRPHGPVRLAELLEGAGAAGANRVMLCGRRPPPAWQEQAIPAGWEHDPVGHFYDADDPCGRYVQAGRRVQVRRAAPYFGDAPPTAARLAWVAVGVLLRRAFRDDRAVLLDSPAATGQQLWALSLPADWMGCAPDDDTAALIRRTSPQHRIEATAGCPGGCDQHRRPAGRTVRQVHYLDGRLMYAALTRGLAVGGARRLTGAESLEQLDRDPYTRMRLHVTGRVPDGWDHLGVLLCRHPDGQHWHAPSLPGTPVDTWCDAAEWWQAAGFGWQLEVVEGVAFTGSTRALDLWAERLGRARAGAAAVAGDLERAAVLHALRAILLTTIGAFHSTGRDRTVVVDGPAMVPAGCPFDIRPDGTAVYRRSVELTGNAASFAHPEVSSQLWGRAHTRLLHHRGAGALAVPADAVLGLFGDALYLDRPAPWQDDGRIGALRPKGRIAGRIARPTSLAQLNRLRDRIERTRA